ncbi:MAG: nucleotidyl transferase AbiEii/AbiGii toxin family protein [Janthinobacterium lividum]
MDLFDEHYLGMLAAEAFIRRAAALNLPFMLKGSYVTRQYFANPLDREPQDLDWVYVGGRLGSEAEARALFDEWVIRVTEHFEPDGAVFDNFRKNAFWRGIDYAMADDFPTVNTDLICQLYQADGSTRLIGLGLDVSFNLPMDVPSEPLYYIPLQGEPFLVEHSTPPALQVAWKLHQTLVRPRLKDLFDLRHLLRHPDFTAAVRQQALEALRRECRADGTDPTRLRYLLAGELAPLYPQQDVEEIWQHWRHQRDYSAAYRATKGFVWHSDRASHITDPQKLPATLADFAQQLRDAFAAAGFAAEAPLTEAARRKPASKR